MDMQNVAKLDIPEGEVRTIHDKDGRLIWGKVSYGVKYKGDTAQTGDPTPDAPVAVQTVTGENAIKISDGQGNEQSYPISLGSIELCKIGTYQDYIYKSGGKWYKHAEIGKVALDSTYYNSRYGTNSYGLTQFLVELGASDYYDTTNYTNMLSNSFIKQATSFANTQTQGFLPALDSGLHKLRAWIRILTTTADTADQFKAWLNTNSPIFYYKLDTPTDTEITNEALIGQLDVVEQWLTRYGYNATVSGNLPIIIDRTAL